MIDKVRRFLLRDLATLRREVELYPDDETLWRELPGVTNPGGTLVLHLVGNVRHFIGARLGASGYVRDRTGEFARRGLSRAELLAEVDAAVADAALSLDSLDPRRLDDDFPGGVGGHALNTGVFLIHLCVHLGYHIGQIDYHRRVASGRPLVADAMSIGSLAESAS